MTKYDRVFHPESGMAGVVLVVDSAVSCTVFCDDGYQRKFDPETLELDRRSRKTGEIINRDRGEITEWAAG